MKKSTKTKPASPKKRSRKPRTKRRNVPRAGVAELEVREIQAIREEIERRTTGLDRGLSRWNANPEDVQKSVAQLVLALVEFLRKLLERQAIRRMETSTLTAEETERVGLALMRLEETVADVAARFGLTPEELNLDLGPIGRLI